MVVVGGCKAPTLYSHGEVFIFYDTYNLFSLKRKVITFSYIKTAFNIVEVLAKFMLSKNKKTNKPQNIYVLQAVVASVFKFKNI